MSVQSKKTVAESQSGALSMDAHAVAETAQSDEVAAAAMDALEADDDLSASTDPRGDEDDDDDLTLGDGTEAPERLKSIIESLLFASDKPLPLKRMQELTGERDMAPIRAAIEWLRADYADRGVVLHEVAGGFQFRTSPLNAYWVQQMVAGRPVRLSRAQLETLAILAYRQPMTRPEIDDIRGVDSGASLKSLLDRELIRVLGRKEEPGRPLIYGTSKHFLEFFNLADLKELPTLREFAELNDESLDKVRELDEKQDAASEGQETPADAEAGESAETTDTPVADQPSEPSKNTAA